MVIQTGNVISRELIDSFVEAGAPTQVLLKMEASLARMTAVAATTFVAQYVSDDLVLTLERYGRTSYQIQEITKEGTAGFNWSSQFHTVVCSANGTSLPLAEFRERLMLIHSAAESVPEVGRVLADFRDNERVAV